VVTAPRNTFTFDPLWAPDGRTLIYERAGSGASEGVFRVRASGGTSRRILPIVGRDLAWQSRH
jgi:Tol biopolymer transport system component